MPAVGNGVSRAHVPVTAPNLLIRVANFDSEVPALTRREHGANPWRPTKLKAQRGKAQRGKAQSSKRKAQSAKLKAQRAKRKAQSAKGKAQTGKDGVFPSFSFCPFSKRLHAKVARFPRSEVRPERYRLKAPAFG
jgi:hypothetical protein